MDTSKIEEIVRRYEAGESVETIGGEVGIRPCYIPQIAKAAGASPRRGGKPAGSFGEITDSTIKLVRNIIDKVQAGATIQAVADELGCTKAHAANIYRHYRIFKKMGLINGGGQDE